jgi:hypothetical protein
VQDIILARDAYGDTLVDMYKEIKALEAMIASRKMVLVFDGGELVLRNDPDEDFS